MIMKQIVFRVLVYSELTLLGLFYVLSPHGMQAITQLQRECEDMGKQLAHVKDDIAALEREINLWESDSFYKEKIAREQLQMVRPGDVVYYTR